MIDDEDEAIDDDDEEDDDADEDSEDGFDRAEKIAGNTSSFEKSVDNLFRHLKENLSLPCEVTGSEDFRWEEGYAIFGHDPRGYKELKKTNPSYTDKFELLRIEREGQSEWMMFPGEDIAAHVRRKSDGKKFILGLVELKATDKRSQNYQLINDFGVWLVNSR